MNLLVERDSEVLAAHGHEREAVVPEDVHSLEDGGHVVQ